MSDSKLYELVDRWDSEREHVKAHFKILTEGEHYGKIFEIGHISFSDIDEENEDEQVTMSFTYDLVDDIMPEEHADLDRIVFDIICEVLMSEATRIGKPTSDHIEESTEQ